MRFQVIKAASIKMSVLQDDAQCSLVMSDHHPDDRR